MSDHFVDWKRMLDLSTDLICQARESSSREPRTQAQIAMAVSLHVQAEVAVSAERRHALQMVIASVIVRTNRSVVPTAALDGLLLSWDSHPDLAQNIVGSIRQAGWFVDLYWGVAHEPCPAGVPHVPSERKWFCSKCGIDWRRVKP